MKVMLHYFKPSGKWYSSGEYETEREELFEIWEEVRDMNPHPGLVNKWDSGPIWVEVPEHPHAHPHLVMP